MLGPLRLSAAAAAVCLMLSKTQAAPQTMMTLSVPERGVYWILRGPWAAIGCRSWLVCVSLAAGCTRCSTWTTSHCPDACYYLEEWRRLREERVLAKHVAGRMLYQIDVCRLVASTCALLRPQICVFAFCTLSSLGSCRPCQFYVSSVQHSQCDQAS